MLDVHPPHHAANSWKDFFIHIATIVIGLLIAVGLEQTVEYVHHRREVEETRKALEVERRICVCHFAGQTAEFHRIVPKLQMNLAILMYLGDHPHAPASQWPGSFSTYNVSYRFPDSAWKTAMQNNIVALMPAGEVQRDARLYLGLHNLGDQWESARASLFEWNRFRMYAPDPSSWSPEQVDTQMKLMASILNTYRVVANESTSLGQNYKDFQPALTEADMELILPLVDHGKENIVAAREISDRTHRADAAIRAAAGEPAEVP